EIKSADNLVFIHDAARPLLSRDDLSALIEMSPRLFEKKEGLLPAEKMKDTVKRVAVENGETYVSQSLPRAELAAVSTPQIFPLDELLQVYALILKTSGNVPTDEGEIYFQAGRKVGIHYLKHGNPKLTTAEDLPVIEALFTSKV
ncbi:MAG: 2-C-methyl-D-erythritol 4-phosphate cytidylyltransferase, partial [Spirochaetia bacterium]|nr:2-C-methyl-D-erythritol 4-phosphate cytidylyltransferase [Spirochaetia bacterium]